MLRIHTVTSAADAKRYYAVSDYYREGQSQETIGLWGGKLAERLGLSGQVTKEAFDRLCDNRHPSKDEPLTARTNDERRVGNDMVFSGPKSFAIIEAFAPPEERQLLLADFDESVRETLTQDIEPDMQARIRVGGQDTDRVTGNMAWAEYDHSTARPLDAKTPPDPHRHKHVFGFNATYDPVEISPRSE